MVKMVQYIISVLAAYVIAFNIPVPLVGMLSYTKSLVILFSLFINIGFDSIYNQFNTKDNFEEHFPNLFFIYLIFTLVNHIPFYILIFFVNFNTNWFPLFILLIVSTISNLEIPLVAHLDCKMESYKVDVPVIIFSTTEYLFQILIAIGNYNNPIELLVINTLIFTIIKLFALLIYAKGQFKITKINKHIIKDIFKRAKPIMLITCVSIFYVQLQFIVIDLSFGHEQLQYYYFAFTYIIGFLLIITGSVRTLYMSMYSIKYKNGKIDEIQKIANIVEKYSSIIFMFVILFVLINGKLIFDIFLPMYSISMKYLYILIFVPYIAGISRPYLTMMIPGDKQTDHAKFEMISMIIMIIVIITLVPIDIIYLCYLELFAWIGASIFYKIYTYKVFELKSYKNILVHMCAGAMILIFFYVIDPVVVCDSNCIKNYNMITLMVNTGIIIILYFGTLLLLKEIQISDIKFMMSFIRRK